MADPETMADTEIRWAAEYQLRHQDDWTSIPIKDEPEGYEWLGRWDRGGTIVRARIVRIVRTVTVSYGRDGEQHG